MRWIRIKFAKAVLALTALLPLQAASETPYRDDIERSLLQAGATIVMQASGASSGAPDEIFYSHGDRLISRLDDDGLGRYAMANEYIVVFRQDLDQETIGAALSDLANLQLKNTTLAYGQSDVALITLETNGFLPSGLIEATVAEALSDLALSIEPNFIATLYQNQIGHRINSGQWHLRNTGLKPGTKPDMDVDGAEAIAFMLDGQPPSDPVKVMVLDSGIDLDHPALVSRIWTNPSEIAGNGIDDDGNGLVDDVHGWNFANNTADLTDRSKSGHGTFASGIIAAQPHGGDIITRGLAPHAEIMTGVIAYSEEITTSWDTLNALNYGIDQGAKVINMSFGSPNFSNAILQAVNNARTQGVFLVAAAGNEGIDVGLTPVYPCSYAVVTCVAALDPDGELASYSNFQNYNLPIQPAVRIAAPGTDLLGIARGGGHAVLKGTSFAAPQVAATYANLAQTFPNDSWDQIQARLYHNTDRSWQTTSLVYKTQQLNAYTPLVGPVVGDASTPARNAYCSSQSIPPDGTGGPSRWNNFPFANSFEAGIDGRSFETAFTICKISQLMNISRQYHDRIFVLKSDLDWRELSANAPRRQLGIGTPFNGQIIGSGHSIRNLYINSPRHPQAGALIRQLGPQGKIFNLRLSNVDISARTGDAAGLVIENKGEIRFVEVEGTIRGDYTVGGIVSTSEGGSIRDSFFSGKLSWASGTHKQTSFTGGIVGYAINLVELSDNVVDATFDSEGIAGGITAYAGFGTLIDDSHAWVNFGDKVIGGGLVGRLACYSRLRNSYSEGSMAGTDKLGGLVGYISSAEVTNAYSLAYVGRYSFPIDDAPALSGTGGAIAINEDGVVQGTFPLENWVYVCTGDRTPPPNSTLSDVFYIDWIGNRPGVGGQRKSNQALKSQATFNTWPLGSVWFMRPDFSPILREAPRKR